MIFFLTLACVSLLLYNVLFQNAFLLCAYVTGDVHAVGGLAGVDAENGGSGTVYMHQLPQNGTLLVDRSELADHLIVSQNKSLSLTNRTLLVDNRGRSVGSTSHTRSVSDAYGNFSSGSSTAWIFPDSYPSFVPAIITSSPDVDIVIDYLRVYGSAELALFYTCNDCDLNIRLGSINGK